MRFGRHSEIREIREEDRLTKNLYNLNSGNQQSQRSLAEIEAFIYSENLKFGNDDTPVKGSC